MEESISSSRTAGASLFYRDVHCYASDGPPAAVEASEDSGWTDYFYDDDNDVNRDNYLELQASEEESTPALREKKPHRHGYGYRHGDRASASSTVSSASKIKAYAKKAGAEENKKRPRWEPADEDPLQDTASSLPANAARQVQLQDDWQIAGCCEQRSSDTALQWIDYCSLQETRMGLPGEARCGKGGICMLN